MKLKIFLMMIYSMLFIFISNIIMILSNLLSKKNKLNFEKMSPFECGFNPIKFQRMPFSMRFFLITVIFLIFDVEIALMLPMILTINMSNYYSWMLFMLLFMLILMLGLIWEWMQGALNWL